MCVCVFSGECGTEQLFRVKDWELRARVALQGLERWPLHSCLELLQFCLSDSSPDHMLTPQLRQKKHELDMYNRVCVCVCLTKLIGPTWGIYFLSHSPEYYLSKMSGVCVWCVDADTTASIEMADMAGVEGGVEQKPRVHVLLFAGDPGQSENAF